MCDFCTKHGDGKIWYKNAKNYARDLMEDLRRRQYIHDFLESTIGAGISSLGRLETIYRKKKNLPARLVKAMVDKARDEHFGQVVPIEDIRTIVGGAETVVRMPCACRWAAEKKEKRCCYSVSYSPETWWRGLDMSYFGKAPAEGFESLSGAEAIAQMEVLGREGAVHTIWTMITPFIGAICNCTNRECLGLRTLALEVETLARGEYVAMVNRNLCNGCGLCEDACQFEAISSRMMDGGETVAFVQHQKCYGCGLCRHHCPQGALALIEM
ncbi:MAG: 4Fe-4S binding protein [Proteobacteria bacterium]|nr:4Fe-4S binding protein [Pseudomonadota bacterium]MBU1715569.1 4Fe-4S binding protein [Pseudomonadota bacterium]